MKTPEEAKTLLCPLARTFGLSTASSTRRGEGCAFWRWERITVSHPLWRDAVKAKAAETGEKVPYPQAAKWVAENMAALGLVPTRGYCGAGGEP